MNKILLKNNIPLIIKNNKKTPRIALSIFFRVNKAEEKAGIYVLLSRLLMQGTTNRNAQKIAQELEENAIECYCEILNDYLRFSIVCLNENLNIGVEILEDIIKNSHFKNFEKELFKLKGEYIAELDSPKVLARDTYLRNIFKNHFYGNTYTKVLEEADNIKKEDIQNTYNELLKHSNKVISVVGDFDEKEMESLINNSFLFLEQGNKIDNTNNYLKLESPVITKIRKDDAQQAQIIKGWLVPSIYNKDYPTLVVINTLLGSSGLSSRLYLELREKKGLAYDVRSRYEAYCEAANFNVYIGTEASNINVSIKGFDTEIEKLKKELVSDNELEYAKNNIIGKKIFISETNERQSNLYGVYEINGKGYNYCQKFIEEIKNVRKEDIQIVTNKYFGDNYVLTILAPEKYLKE